MEDIIAMIPSHLFQLVRSRQLVGQVQSQKVPEMAQWKIAMWEKGSIEPAMLRVPIVITFFMFLWGLNIWALDRSMIRSKYLGALSIKSGSLPVVLLWSAILIAIYSLTMTIFSNMLGMAIESGVSVFYSILLLLVIFPILPGLEIRAHFGRVFKLVLFPGNSISFTEVLLADALTSVSKVLKDIGVTLIALYAHFNHSKIGENHNTGMIIIAVLASMPFWLRIRQCYVQFAGSTEFWVKFCVTLNMIKYATAFPPIWLAASSSLGYFHQDLPAITAAMAAINSLYSYLWDITMDWGLLTITRKGRIIPRQRMSFPVYSYFIAAVLNLVLRFSWASNRIPQFQTLHPSHLVLMAELIEVFRRGMWNIFRIEWEVIVLEDRLILSKDDEDEKLMEKE